MSAREKYSFPERWYDKHWERERHLLLAQFLDSTARALIDLRECHWIDLLPLGDLLLQSAMFARRGGRIRFLLHPTRAASYLVNAGFFRALLKAIGDEASTVEIDFRGRQTLTLRAFCADPPAFPPPVLDVVHIVPCEIWDINTFASRESIFSFTRQLLAEHVGTGKGRALKIPLPLIYELKAFFQSILPELLDNVRVHKGDMPLNLTSFYLRLRRRDERLYGHRAQAEPSMQNLTTFKEATLFLWQRDILEAVLLDSGKTIQETWLASSAREPRPGRKIPRLPSGTRVDGPNGDLEILKGVFSENASSLSDKERTRQKLPRLTGLHSLRQTLHGTEWNFSVRSGRSLVLVLNDDSETPPKPRSGGIVEPTPGVAYFFRFSSPIERALSGWYHIAAEKDIADDPSWWIENYPSRFARALITEGFHIPDAAKRQDVLICRARHAIGKNELYSFLLLADRKGIEVVFADLVTSLALRLYLLIEELRNEADPLESSYPILTNTLHLAIAGAGKHRPVLSFVEANRGQSASETPWWWERPGAPIRSASEVFSRCRQYDSALFWEHVAESPSSFVPEPVQWSPEWILGGGYLDFHSALRNRDLRKLLRRRTAWIVQSLRAKNILVTGDTIRFFAAEVRRNCLLESDDNAPVVVLDSVMVTGKTAESTARLGRRAYALALFVYPSHLIISSDGDLFSRRRTALRVLDWHPKFTLFTRERTPFKPTYRRVGSTDMIESRPQSLLPIHSLQRPEQAYSEWQSLSLISVGHSSYLDNHLFISIDLLAFLTSRSSELNSMLLRMVSRINDLSPAAIFYFPHESAEELIDGLSRAAAANDLQFPGDRLIPISSAASIALHLKRLEPGNVVFVNDAMTSGSTIRSLRAQIEHLHANDSGPLRNLYSFVILDRCDPVTALSGYHEQHFAWWSLGVPTVGRIGTCTICQALSKLEAITEATHSKTLKAILDQYRRRWSQADNLGQFSSELEEHPLEVPIFKKLGRLAQPNVEIRTVEALATWALDMTARLNYFSYPFEGERRSLSSAMPEILAGFVFLFWKRLSFSQRQRTLAAIVDQMWSEEQTEDMRGLLILAASGLQHRDAQELFNLLEVRLKEEGLHGVEGALMLYVVAKLAASEGWEPVHRLESIGRELVVPQSRIPSRQRDKTLSLLQCLVDATRAPVAALGAIEVLGLPERGIRHSYLLELLKELRSDKREQLDYRDLLKISIFLDPVRSLVSDRPDIFEAYGVRSDLLLLLAQFDELIFSFHSAGELEERREIFQNLYRFLAVDIWGRPNVREIVTDRFIHYLPFRVRQIASEVSAGSAADFLIDVPLKPEEHLLLGGKHSGEDFRRLVRSLSRYDVVVGDRRLIDGIVRDLLLDVKHPRSADRRIRETAYLLVEIVERRQQPFQVELRVSNFASQEQFQEMMIGRSWQLICVHAERLGAQANAPQFEPETGILTRRIVFPGLPGRLEVSNDRPH